MLAIVEASSIPVKAKHKVIPRFKHIARWLTVWLNGLSVASFHVSILRTFREIPAFC